jgi:hypothetical protein
MYDGARFLGVINQQRILRVGRRCHVEVRAGQEQPRYRYSQFLDGIVTLIPRTGIPDTCHAVVQKHVRQFEAATMEVCVDEAGEQRQTGSVEVFARGRTDAGSRSGRHDPFTFDHNYRVLDGRATSAVNQSRA